MLSLVSKDLRSIALYLCVIVPTLGLLVFGALLAGRVFLALSCVTALILVAVAPALEYSLGADPFVHSLPVSRADVVKARYATSLLLAGGCLTLSAGMAVIFAASIATRRGAWPSWIAVETLLAAVLYVSVYLSVFLACVFRFGMGKGGVVATMVLAVLAPVGLRFVPPEAVTRLMAEVGTAPAVAGVVLTTGLLIWLSMRISMHYYERREF